jgi:hypothetical protein
MRRFWIALLILATVIAIGLPAVAAPPKCDIPGNENLPGCGGEDPTTTTTTTATEPIYGTTCDNPDGVYAANGGLAEGPYDTDFDVVLFGDKAYTCVDVFADEGEWTVTVVEAIGVRSLTIVPRDSIAWGDSCGGYMLRNVTKETTITLPGPDNDSDIDGDGKIEAAYVNSCGTQFSEWVDVGGTLTEFADADPSVISPLALQVDMRGSKDAEVRLRVTLP